MNEGQKALLKRYHQRLAEDIIVTEDLLGELYQAGIFQMGMIELIRAERTPTERTQKLLEMLPKRGPDALDLFVGVLEKSYPWLATLLASANVKPSGVAQESSHRPSLTHGIKVVSTSHSYTEYVDGDIKKIVQAFVHKQFGQSKRISEKDKKSVERFVSDQIQRERTRYQSMMTSTPCSTPCSDMGSTSDNVFQFTEVQNNLFSIHMKMEPYILDKNNNSNNKSCSCDDVDHGDNHHHHHHHQHPAKLMPEDMDFLLITKEVEVLIRHIEILEAKIADALAFFDTRLHKQPLASLVGNLVGRCEAMEEDTEQDRQQITQLLNECNNYSDHIEKLEKERVEHRNQIQAAYMDMAKLRQEKNALLEKLQRLEKDRAQQQAEKDRLREGFRLGIISKAATKTPRGGNTNSYYSSQNTSGNTGSGQQNGDDGSVTQSGYSRRTVTRGAPARTTVAYTGYSKRYQGGSRYSMLNKKKPNGKDGSASSTTKY